tara:strand:+ start:9103 stop:10812 length:1710 start_codon:yes stop_codon:yes gene_type:complete
LTIIREEIMENNRWTVLKRYRHSSKWHPFRKTALLALSVTIFGTGTVIGQTQRVATHYALNSAEVPAKVLQNARPKVWKGNERGPVEGLMLYRTERPGAVWLGSDEGAVRFDGKAAHRWDRWQYFHGRRWLQDNDIQNIHVEEGDGLRKVWIRTKTGVSLIEWRPMTLAEKAAHYEKMIDDRHLRHGFVSGCGLFAPGDTSTSQTRDSDNEGLWTAMYLAAEAYRYAVTGSEDALWKARRSMRALMRLEEITGITGFFARSFKSVDEPPHGGGEWHPTPDGKWLWKGDTSSDEAVGHYYAYAIYFDLVATEEEKAEMAEVLSRITDHIMENDWNLIDVDGKPTRWGVWGTEYFKTPEGEYEKALRSLELLSMLKTAHHITGNQKYDDAYRDRLDHGYGTNTLYYRRWISEEWEINFSDDELYYLSAFPLFLYEDDPALRDNYLASVRFTWSQIRPDMNPLWNFMSVASGAGAMTDDILKESLMTLDRIPLEMVEWRMENSHRIDIQLRPLADRSGHPQTTFVLPPDERRIHKWNTNPFIPDGGGDGSSEETPTYWLLPYWMGRYYGWIE